MDSTHTPELSTRERILHLLKLRGPSTAAELAVVLRITAVAVRQHLQELSGLGLVEARVERRPVGRPARRFRLGPAAASRFPDAHAQLAVEMLASLQDALGPEGLKSILRARLRRQLESYRGALPSADVALGERVRALASLRESEGYMAAAEALEGEGYRLVENHCPICVAATHCQGLCDNELELFQECLGAEVEIRRTEHIVEGARRCVYEIRPRAGVGASAT